MDWHAKSYAQLSKDELYAIFKARVDVFVVEQNCPYPEIDDIDIADDTLHLFMLSGSELMAYARCYRKSDSCAAIGRVLVTAPARGKGIAKALMLRAIECCEKKIKHQQLEIAAQCYLDGFYTELGFAKQGEEYLEDGIPHQDMVLQKGVAK